MKITTFLETSRITRIHLEPAEQFRILHHPSDLPILVDLITVTRYTTDGVEDAPIRRLDGYQLRVNGEPGRARRGRILAADEDLPAGTPAQVLRAISAAQDATS